MKTIIIYYSKTGFTEKYARWLAEEISCRAVGLNEGGSEALDAYDTVIFASWLHAGKIQKLNWFKKQEMRGKRVVLAVGAAPLRDSSVREIIAGNFPEDQKDYKVFYLPGGLSYERMGRADRLFMKIFAGMLDKIKDKTEEQRQMAEAVRTSYDLSDKKYLEPVRNFISSLEK